MRIAIAVLIETDPPEGQAANGPRLRKARPKREQLRRMIAEAAEQAAKQLPEAV